MSSPAGSRRPVGTNQPVGSSRPADPSRLASWRPAPAFALTGWIADLEAAPPLDATIFQVERRDEPAGDWVPVLGEENWTLGDRDGAIRDVPLSAGCEVMRRSPNRPAARPAPTSS